MNRFARVGMGRFAPIVALLALVGCGSKTALRTPHVDASVDAAPLPIDAFVVVDAPPDAFVPPDGGPIPPDHCIELPPMEPPKSVDVAFVSRITSAEVYFLVDVTGSMGEEIEQIRTGLLGTIIPGIRAAIPDVRFSVARYADYPVDPYGSSGGGGVGRDDVYRLEQASTSDAMAVQAAVNRLSLQSGGDVPESTTEALYITATGETPGSLVPPPRCPVGTVGYPCFEATGSRIFLLFTDAPFHNGPAPMSESYGADLLYANHDYDETVSALRRIGARVLGLYSGPPADTGWTHLQRVARDTGAITPDGQPIVFDIGSGGASLGSDVIDAVGTLVEEVPIDVDALVEDFPGDALDANEFVIGIRAVRAEPAGGATILPDRFADVRPGTRVTFTIDLANESIPRGPEPQRYRMTVVLRGDAVTRLTETVVDVVIPAEDGAGCEEIFPGMP